MYSDSELRKSNYDYHFKVLLVGETEAKQACKFYRYADDKTSNSHMSSLGIDFKNKIISMRGYMIKLQIWDTAGQERFHSLSPKYFGQADGVMFVYDNSNAASFNMIKKLLNGCKDPGPGQDQSVKMVFGNKSDQEDKHKRAVSKKDGKDLASIYKAKFVETSSESITNVELAFLEIANTILDNKLSKVSAGSDSEDQYSSQDECLDAYYK